MEPQNKVFEDHFTKTIVELDRYKASLINNIQVTKDQLTSMEKELENLEQTMILQKGGKTAIEFCTANNIALVQVASLQPQQQPQQPQQPQPTQQSYTPAPPITPQAQQAFAPPTYPSQADMQAAQSVQGPQMVQGTPPADME